MIRRERDHQQISSWKKEKPGTCSHHAFRTTDFKLHINLDWTSQKLAENSLGLHRSSREKTLSSYEHRQKNGAKGGKCGEKVKKRKIFFCLNQRHWPPAPDPRHHIAYLDVHSFAVLVYLQRQLKKERWVTRTNISQLVHLSLGESKHMLVSNVCAKPQQLNFVSLVKTILIMLYYIVLMTWSKATERTTKWTPILERDW